MIILSNQFIFTHYKEQWKGVSHCQKKQWITPSIVHNTI